jgi:hypothetical protein
MQIFELDCTNLNQARIMMNQLESFFTLYSTPG